MMIEGSGSGSIPLTRGSGSGRPKTRGFAESGSGFGSVSGTLLYRKHFQKCNIFNFCDYFLMKRTQAF